MILGQFQHALAYAFEIAPGLDAAIERALAHRASRSARSIGVAANAVDLLERLLERGIVPDALTDQTSAHDVLSYVPCGHSLAEANALRERDPALYSEQSLDTMVRHVRALVELLDRGAVVFDYGNNLRQRAKERGCERAFAFPGFVPAYIRPQFCLGRGPFRWVALSGDPQDIFTIDRALIDLFPDQPGLKRWLELARDRLRLLRPCLVERLGGELAFVVLDDDGERLGEALVVEGALRGLLL